MPARHSTSPSICTIYIPRPHHSRLGSPSSPPSRLNKALALEKPHTAFGNTINLGPILILHQVKPRPDIQGSGDSRSETKARVKCGRVRDARLAVNFEARSQLGLGSRLSSSPSCTCWLRRRQKQNLSRGKGWQMQRWRDQLTVRSGRAVEPREEGGWRRPKTLRWGCPWRTA